MTNRIYQLKITLKDIHPPVWRRVQVPETYSLLQLHDVIQTVFGWLDYHLHEFKINNQSYGDPDDDEYDYFGTLDEVQFRLKDVLKSEKQRFTYTYDFGDDWVHYLLVEKILDAEKGVSYPRCLAGKRACPPEDVGGPYGYVRFLEALGDPDDEEHEEYTDWIGGDFDTEAFTLDETNNLLQEPLRKWSGERIPPQGEYDEDKYKNVVSKQRKKLAGWEHHPAAIKAPLRLDMVTLLTYVRNNNVIGTKALGNFPRKVVRAIATQFVNPPVLDHEIGDKIFHFQSEENVRPVYFLHVLADLNWLLTGGPGMPWQLSENGKDFLEDVPIKQDWFLFQSWWKKVNWLFFHTFTPYDEPTLYEYKHVMLDMLLSLPVEQPIEHEAFSKHLLSVIGPPGPPYSLDDALRVFCQTLDWMLIHYLEGFGVVRCKYIDDTIMGYKFKSLENFSVTLFGKTLLSMLRERDGLEPQQ